VLQGFYSKIFRWEKNRRTLAPQKKNVSSTLGPEGGEGASSKNLEKGETTRKKSFRTLKGREVSTEIKGRRDLKGKRGWERGNHARTRDTRQRGKTYS